MIRSPKKLWVWSWWNKVRSYKQYLALILVPYLFLIIIFHTQLTVYDGRGKEDDQDGDGVNSIFATGSQFTRGQPGGDSDIGSYYHAVHGGGTGRRTAHLGEEDDDEGLPDQNHHHILRLSPHQRKNLEVALVEPVDQAEERIPIPQITAEQLGAKGRGLDVKKQQQEQPHDNVAVYDIDWDTQQNNYLENVADLEPVDPNKDNRIELTWKHSSWVSNNKTLNKGTHDGIMMEHCLRNNGPAAGKGQNPKNGTGPAGGPPLTDHSRFQPLLNSFVYTAFYDDRQSGLAYVHIILLLKKIEKPVLYCHFPLGHRNEGTGPKYISVKANYYEMCENHGKDYGGWIAQCEVPSVLGRLPPCEVTLSIHKIYPLKHKLRSDKNKSVHIPIFVLQNPETKALNFGVCVPPLFGYIPTTTLIEYIELTKLLGAQHLTFYAHQIPREVQKVLHYYEDKADITVINWDLPVDNKDIWYHGQLLAINDCLNRNMHKFQYLAFNDIDEFIVPHHGKHLNWTQMITDIANVSRALPLDQHAGYVFQSAFFDPLMDLNTRGLYDLESDLRTKAFSKVRTKVLVHAKRIYELGIHHISKPVNERYKIIDIEPNVAFLHHYRKCVTDFDPRMNCQVFARDESLSRYIPTLRHNVHQVLWTLKEADKKMLGDVFVR